MSVEDRHEKILYVEGEPRFEMKFLRRAVEGDSNLQVVTLQRTAEGKFLRLGVDSAGELAAGFPRTREELFRYRALILGSVEASFFTADQLRMIEEFVSQRGGGLLVLGGRLALGEGGYAGTPGGRAAPGRARSARPRRHHRGLPGGPDRTDPRRGSGIPRCRSPATPIHRPPAGPPCPSCRW